MSAKTLSRVNTRQRSIRTPPHLFMGILASMSVLAAAAMASLAASLWQRWRVADAVNDGVESLVLCATAWLTVCALIATLLAWAGVFDPLWFALVGLGLAASIWPWGKPTPARMTGIEWGPTLAALALVIAAMALRLPPNDYALAGRDQGTYTLRAEHVLRTGALHWEDTVLAQAGQDLEQGSSPRSGPADILGLHRKNHADWRSGWYEGAYRPGWYLADRDAGRVVPQFLHLHPMAMACAGLVLGPERMGWAIPAQSGLLLLLLWCVARRLWPRGPWAFLPVALMAVAPVAIWVHRTALSEVPASLLFWAGALAVLRARDAQGSGLGWAAFFIGATAWVRGNGWLWAPLVLACLWLIPPRIPHRRTPVAIYLGVVASAVLVHALTSFPYLHDELGRQLAALHDPSPARLLGLFGAALIGWWSVDELAFARGPDKASIARVRRRLPWLLVLVGAAGIGAWLMAAHATPGKPHARLDPALPLLGLPLLSAAALGVPITLRRFEPRGAADQWLVALAATVAFTLVLYAQRNLPSLGLYYYGRYLVPELLVAACLLATQTVFTVHRKFAGTNPASMRKLAAALCSGTIAAGLLWSLGGVLVREPAARMQEFDGADQLVDALAEQLEPGAIVIAGGEGWHHGHTFNQIGGALQLRHGVSVLPYRSREAAYATAYELLVTGPAARREPPPPVYLLLNEATHHARLDSGRPPVAVIDDRVEPPLLVTRIWAGEMFVHRLTPVTDQTPTRVTRDELRMVLLTLQVDPARRRERVFELEPEPPELEVDGGAGLRGGFRCLSPDTPLRVRLPTTLEGAAHGVVLVAAPGTAEHNGSWQVEVDGRPRPTSMPKTRPRARDTLGPFWVSSGPTELAVLGARKAVEDAACPHGGVAAIRLLDPPGSVLEDVPTTARTFAPPRDLGHPIEPTQWVSGRGLGRYRPGPSTDTPIAGVSLQLSPEHALVFAPEPVPTDGPVAAIVTLTGADVDPDARIEVVLDGSVVATLDPPEQRTGTWQSKPVELPVTGPIAQLQLRLVGASEPSRVWVRDIGLFSRGQTVQSVVVRRP